jgi:calpain-15
MTFCDVLYFLFRTFCCPFILLYHAVRIYFCGCLGIHIRRWFQTICCFPCRACGCCWLHTDKKFPPEVKSLGTVKGDSARGGDEGKTAKAWDNVVWLRGSEFQKSGAVSLFGSKIDPRDVAQGSLGDCWLLAAIACLAEFPSAIHRLFGNIEVNPQGRYSIRIYDQQDERWKWIQIDDHIPCSKQHYDRDGSINPIFSSFTDVETGDNAQKKEYHLWVLLLEKAFAKFCGSFQALEGGHTIWALRAMTGDKARSFKKQADGKWHRRDVVTPKSEDKRAFGLQGTDEEHSPDDFFKVLKKYDQMKSAICASGASETSGLHGGHAYSILQARQKGNVRLVQLRNPWGTGEWTGDWGDKSDMWTKHPDVAKHVGFVDADDGAFWMSYEDFLANWTEVGICDRAVDVTSLNLEVIGEGTLCGPSKGCLYGCARFWFCCEGYSRIYWPKKSSDKTVNVKSRCCAIL